MLLVTEALITKLVNDNVAAARGPAVAKAKQNKASVLAAISAVILEDKTITKAANKNKVKVRRFQKQGCFLDQL
jgi:hypothetical protein